jgi:release factor glutamine methyltransferase
MAPLDTRVAASGSLRITDLLTDAGRRLGTAGIEDARAEARWLLGRVLGLSTSDLILRADTVLPPALVEQYQEAVRRRAAHEPFAYVVGEREFYGRTFLVDPRVLVPRPETELLIETALAILATWERDASRPERGHPGRPGFVRQPGRPEPVLSLRRNGRAPDASPPLIVDVGTGSGAIACTVALEAPNARIIACDLSLDALAVAGINRDRLGLAGRLHLVRGSLLSWLGQPADLILANLPYIPSARVPTLMPEVSHWEPRLALDGGDDGLDLVRALLADAPRVVTPGGTILLELDPEQMAPAAAMLPGAASTVIRDFAGLDRVLRLDLPR